MPTIKFQTNPAQYHAQTLAVLRQAEQIRRIRLELQAELSSIARPDEQTRRAWREAEKARREF